VNYKFRAWDKQSNQMLRVGQMDFSQWWVSCVPHESKYKCYPLDSGERNSFKNEETDRHILMQYTGINDKNKVEIYEGDIVRRTSQMIGDTYDGFDGKVVFQCAAFYIESLTGKDGIYLWDDVQELEVIGNIFE